MVGSVIRAIQGYDDKIHPTGHFTAMLSLLKVVIRRWSPFRYHVWSNAQLMDRLQENCAGKDPSVILQVLQLYSTLALCGNGAMKILECKGLYIVVQSLGTSLPGDIRLEALKLFRYLTRSAEGCSLLNNSVCEQIVQGIIFAMGGWSSSSENVPSDQMPLVMEACRAACITRWPGGHHSFFWNLGIDRVLLDNLVGSSKNYSTQASISSDKLVAKVYDNNSNTRAYIWDILGWLASHCEEDFLSKTKDRFCCLDVLIFCACAVAVDIMLKRRGSFASHLAEAEPVCRAVLLMVLSPVNYISIKAQSSLSEMANPYGGNLENVLDSLKLTATGQVSMVSDSTRTAVNLISLACCLNLPQFQKVIVKKGGLHITYGILRRCLDSDVKVGRLNTVSCSRSFEEKSCCWNLVEDWEGRDILLFYSLLALSQLMQVSNLICETTSRGTVPSDSCGLIDSLRFILSSNFSPGPKWYAAYILSFFGFFGTKSKFSHKMERALNENDLADLQFLLPDGRSLSVHGAILLARCPHLLPREETFSNNGVAWNGSISLQETGKNHGKLRHEVRISDHVNYVALTKILEYSYTGYFQAQNDLLKPLKVLANCCGLKSLSHMLHQKLPTWGSSGPNFSFIQALEPTKNSFFDIILEAEANAQPWDCSICQLSAPHVHAHKIILGASCDYLRALFHSGMTDSYSQTIKIPVGWKALVKLVNYFYSGELARIETDCIWKNMDSMQQFLELQPYIELSSLAEFWVLEEVANESLNTVTSCLDSDQKASSEVIQCAAELSQWKIVEVAVCSIAHLYPKMRDAGDLDKLGEEVVEMMRTEYVRQCQEL